MNQRRRLLLAVGVRHIDAIGVAVPCQLDRRRGMIPAEIESAQHRPMTGNGERRDLDQRLVERKHAARTEQRHALGARFALVRGIARDDRRALLRRVVFRILDGHAGDVARHRARGPAQGLARVAIHVISFASSSLRNMRTTSDMPSNGVNVTMTMPSVALVRVSPSV